MRSQVESVRDGLDQAVSGDKQAWHWPASSSWLLLLLSSIIVIISIPIFYFDSYYC